MSVVVELWGGPLDGMVVTIPEMAPRLHFPIADLNPPKIERVMYQPAGRMREGRQVYRVCRP